MFLLLTTDILNCLNQSLNYLNQSKTIKVFCGNLFMAGWTKPNQTHPENENLSKKTEVSKSVKGINITI